MPASSPARRRTTFPLWAKREVPRAGRCTGCASTDITRATSTIPRRITSPCSACTAKMPPAKWSARSTQRCTTHEGLNDMVYNRCVGTRYCSNNCPYKVRRFNFLQYADYAHAELEDCCATPTSPCAPAASWKSAPIACSALTPRASRPRRRIAPIRDGEVVTACQAACPTEAIVFGNINDPNSRVASLQGDPLNYGLLAELNTRPRTTYLARLRNPQSRAAWRDRTPEARAA